MYTGTLIEELIAAVERVETHSIVEIETAELERLYFAARPEFVSYEHNLLGVA